MGSRLLSFDSLTCRLASSREAVLDIEPSEGAISVLLQACPATRGIFGMPASLRSCVPPGLPADTEFKNPFNKCYIRVRDDSRRSRSRGRSYSRPRSRSPRGRYASRPCRKRPLSCVHATCRALQLDSAATLQLGSGVRGAAISSHASVAVPGRAQTSEAAGHGAIPRPASCL